MSTLSKRPVTLVYEPADSILFDISEPPAEVGPDGAVASSSPSAEGVLRVTNPDSSAYVVLKVKTNAAERYLVQPHIVMLQPGEVKNITSECPAIRMAAAGAASRVT